MLASQVLLCVETPQRYCRDIHEVDHWGLHTIIVFDVAFARAYYGTLLQTHTSGQF
jgi:hypothetical protein